MPSPLGSGLNAGTLLSGHPLLAHAGGCQLYKTGTPPPLTTIRDSAIVSCVGGLLFDHPALPSPCPALVLVNESNHCVDVLILGSCPALLEHELLTGNATRVFEQTCLTEEERGVCGVWRRMVDTIPKEGSGPGPFGVEYHLTLAGDDALCACMWLRTPASLTEAAWVCDVALEHAAEADPSLWIKATESRCHSLCEALKAPGAGSAGEACRGNRSCRVTMTTASPLAPRSEHDVVRSGGDQPLRTCTSAANALRMLAADAVASVCLQANPKSDPAAFSTSLTSLLREELTPLGTVHPHVRRCAFGDPHTIDDLCTLLDASLVPLHEQHSVFRPSSSARVLTWPTTGHIVVVVEEPPMVLGATRTARVVSLQWMSGTSCVVASAKLDDLGRVLNSTHFGTSKCKDSIARPRVLVRYKESSQEGLAVGTRLHALYVTHELVRCKPGQAPDSLRVDLKEHTPCIASERLKRTRDELDAIAAALC